MTGPREGWWSRQLDRFAAWLDSMYEYECSVCHVGCRRNGHPSIHTDPRCFGAMRVTVKR